MRGDEKEWGEGARNNKSGVRKNEENERGGGGELLMTSIEKT